MVQIGPNGVIFSDKWASRRPAGAPRPQSSPQSVPLFSVLPAGEKEHSTRKGRRQEGQQQIVRLRARRASKHSVREEMASSFQRMLDSMER